MIGIYGIHNTTNDKWYVGQSIDIKRRWKHHLWGLDNGYHYNHHLLRAWGQYGKSSFEFLVLEECEVDVINEREQYWIAKLNALSNGYNQCEGGDSPKGRIVSVETRQAVSVARKGNGNPFFGKHHTDEWKQKTSERQQGSKNHQFGKFGEQNHRSRKVRCVETGVIYSATMEAERQTGINANNICSCCNGKLKTAGKFHWEYLA